MTWGLFQAIGAVTAAGIGAVGAWWYGRRARLTIESELLIRNYLVQLQDAAESLAHRAVNVQTHRGISSMASPAYYRDSSRYAIAHFLGQTRRLTADGVFGHLELRWPGFGTALQLLLNQSERELGSLGGHAFQRYHRRELADLALDWQSEQLRSVSYGAFRELVNQPEHHRACEAVDIAVDALIDAHKLTAVLELVALTIADKTGIPCSIANYAKRKASTPATQS